MIEVHKYDLRLTAEPSRVVMRPFQLAQEPRGMNPFQTRRARRIIDAVLQMDPDKAHQLLQEVGMDFSKRHWQASAVHVERYNHLSHMIGFSDDLTLQQRELIGAFFCHEYSYAAAAIMNPSIVPHTDQSGLGPHDQRFVMSLRTVGEGHISSISFREGILTADSELRLRDQPAQTLAAESEEFEEDAKVIALRPDAVPISGLVIFPFTKAQRSGLEDLRLVKFVDDDGEATYYGTYTAFSGVGIRSELLTTKDFTTFSLEPLSGHSAQNKGMALFPRRINGRYAMLTRPDGESIYYQESDDIMQWDGGELIMSPKFPWELIQIGNCGSPIELDEGWLLLTHGVGAMRKYSISAALLDKDNPHKVLARLPEPLLSPSDENRDGYVPNVLYTCGALKHGDQLFLPYGIADSSVSFAMVDIGKLVGSMV
jgi:predicted GH43/DUF377 family glycosyl hydrolase